MTMLNNVAVVVCDELSAFELGVLCEAFGTDRAKDGFPRYDFAVCSPGGRPVTTKHGFTVQPSHDLDRVEFADLVAVPAIPWAHVPEEVLAQLRKAHERGARVMSVCSGAFVLGQAGLLDGRACTTHWMYADELQRMFPTARVDPNVLYVEDDGVLTSAGTAAGVDLCLYVVRQEHGSAIANKLARRMVVPPHRDGGQAQFVQTPVPISRSDSLEPLLSWMMEHLDEEHTVEDLARRAHMSPRSFARHFRSETGTTPHRWLIGQRILLAQQLLEEGDEPIEAIAARCGFGSAATLRHHFARWRGTTPQAFRSSFRGRRAA
jgi:AraC family transcriptional regulator, transcriptional activator FtrA